MQVRYDEEVDAAYIRLSSKHPQGAVEIDEGVILHLTDRDEIVSIEILDASKRFPVKNLFKYQVTTS
jgi:uncharacterized protein YuzE